MNGRRGADPGRVGAWSSVERFLRRIPRQERARSVVHAILDAAEEGLEREGDGPIASLLTRAGVAAGSFYEYFSSRDALLSAVVGRVTERNFDTFLSEIDAVTAQEPSFEEIVRRAAAMMVGHYLRHPAQVRSVIRLADRLGLLGEIVRERDRFADAIAARTVRFTPEMSDAARVAMIRAGADALTGVVVVSLFRTPPPSIDEVGRAAGDAAWGVLRAHIDRAREAARGD